MIEIDTEEEYRTRKKFRSTNYKFSLFARLKFREDIYHLNKPESVKENVVIKLSWLKILHYLYNNILLSNPDFDDLVLAAFFLPVVEVIYYS